MILILIDSDKKITIFDLDFKIVAALIVSRYCLSVQKHVTVNDLRVIFSFRIRSILEM